MNEHLIMQMMAGDIKDMCNDADYHSGGVCSLCGQAAFCYHKQNKPKDMTIDEIISAYEREVALEQSLEEEGYEQTAEKTGRG